MLGVANARAKLTFSDGEAEAPLWPLYINSSVVRSIVTEGTVSDKQANGTSPATADETNSLLITIDGGTCRAAIAKQALAWVGKECKLYREIAKIEVEDANAANTKSGTTRGLPYYEKRPRIADGTLPFLADDVVGDALKFFDHFDLEVLLEASIEMINLRGSPLQIAAVDAIRPMDASWASKNVVVSLAYLLTKFNSDMNRELAFIKPTHYKGQFELDSDKLMASIGNKDAAETRNTHVTLEELFANLSQPLTLRVAKHLAASCAR